MVTSIHISLAFIVTSLFQDKYNWNLDACYSIVMLILFKIVSLIPTGMGMGCTIKILLKIMTSPIVLWLLQK